MVARRCGTRYEFILRVILVLVYLCAAASCRMERETRVETRDERERESMHAVWRNVEESGACS